MPRRLELIGIDETREVTFRVYERKPQDLTFWIKLGFRVPQASLIRIECYKNRESKQPYNSVVIGEGERSGLKLYNTSKGGDHTLSNKEYIQEDIIKRNKLSADMEIPGTLSVKENGTHLYKLYIKESVNRE